MTFARIRQFVIRYERHLSVAATALGFVLDNQALRRPDLLPEALLLYFYLVSSALLILSIHFVEEGVWKGRTASFVRPWLPLAFQFIIGSWFSAFIVFYSRGASFSTSWPFLLIVFFLFVGTELFHKYHDRLVFQNLLYFFALFSFAVFAVPLVVGRIGTWVFLLSGAVSVMVYSIFLWILYVTGPKRFRTDGRRIIRGVVVVYALLNVLYFMHVLPPLPLSLKDIGVYHSLVRTETGYQVSGENVSWIEELMGGTNIHIMKGESVYVFSSVFTPLAIKTNLVHRWEKYDAANKKWIQTSIIEFPAFGGRDGGYRGFSEISGISEGEWRVSVETPDKALIGRITFTVEFVSEPAALQKSAL